MGWRSYFCRKWGVKPAFDDPKYAGKLLPYGIPLYDYNGDGKITINANTGADTPDSPASIYSPFAPYGKDNARDFLLMVHCIRIQ